LPHFEDNGVEKIAYFDMEYPPLLQSFGFPARKVAGVKGLTLVVKIRHGEARYRQRSLIGSAPLRLKYLTAFMGFCFRHLN